MMLRLKNERHNYMQHRVDYNRTIQAVLDADNETGRLTVLSYRTLINDEGTYTININ